MSGFCLFMSFRYKKKKNLLIYTQKKNKKNVI